MTTITANDHKRGILGLGALGLLGLLCPGQSPAASPALTARVTAVYSPQADTTALQLWGSDFGEPVSGAAVVVRSHGARLTIPATDPRVFLWRPDRIVLGLPFRALHGRVRVRTPGSATRAARIRDAWAYESFPLGDGAPLELALDPAGRLWVNSEFHVGFQMFDPHTEEVLPLRLAARPGPAPFATMLFGDHESHASDAGEDVVVDPAGRVWFSEGGALNYHGTRPNHSRIVCFDPAPGFLGDRFRVYAIPGDNNEVVGLAYDAPRHRVWFTENATAKNARGEAQPAKLVSFDPDTVPADDTAPFGPALEGLRCAPGEADAACYHDYPLPAGTYLLGHVTLDPAGFAWYAAFVGGGNVIGRLDPATGTVVTYPLPRAIGQSLGALFLGSGPWELRTAANGDVVVQEFYDSQVTRFDFTRVDDPACRTLDAAGTNPCMTTLVIPGADLARQFTAGINFDGRGRLWLGLGSATDAGSATNGIGYVTADWTRIVMLPPLGVFPGAETMSFSGVVPNDRGDVVWFGEYQRRRLGQLRKLR